MKKCPNCAEDIQVSAKKCKHCKSDLRSWFRRHWILSTIGFFFIIGSILSVLAEDQQNLEISSGTSPNVTNYELELESFNTYKKSGFAHISGMVKNITEKKLESIQAVGEFFDKNGDFVKSDTALIEYNPILAGQSSPFEVLTSDNPAIVTGRVQFKRFFGGTISTKYPEKK